MGIKINLSLLNSTSNDRYVFLVKGNTDIANYFENWVGLDDSKEENKDANALYNISNKINLPDDITRDELKKKIFDFAKGSRYKIINLRLLSEYLYKDENIIPEYATLNNIDIDGEFKLSGKNLKLFYKLSVLADDIELSAPRDFFSEKIHIDGDKVIIHSSNLVKEIKAND